MVYGSGIRRSRGAVTTHVSPRYSPDSALIIGSDTALFGPSDGGGRSVNYARPIGWHRRYFDSTGNLGYVTFKNMSVLNG